MVQSWAVWRLGNVLPWAYVYGQREPRPKLTTLPSACAAPAVETAHSAGMANQYCMHATITYSFATAHRSGWATPLVTGSTFRQIWNSRCNQQDGNLEARGAASASTWGVSNYQGWGPHSYWRISCRTTSSTEITACSNATIPQICWLFLHKQQVAEATVAWVV